MNGLKEGKMRLARKGLQAGFLTMGHFFGQPCFTLVVLVGNAPMLRAEVDHVSLLLFS